MRTPVDRIALVPAIHFWLCSHGAGEMLIKGAVLCEHTWSYLSFGLVSLETGHCEHSKRTGNQTNF